MAKPDKAAKKQRQAWCRARTKAGHPCQAPAVERLCFFHAHPGKLAELGRQGGRKNGRGRLGNSARPVLALLLILRADFGSSAVERLEPGVTATCAGLYATHRDARERARQRRRRFAPHVDCHHSLENEECRQDSGGSRMCGYWRHKSHRPSR